MSEALIKDSIDKIPIAISLVSLGFSLYVLSQYRRRHLRQKITEMALGFVLDKSKTANTAWFHIANSMNYISYLCLLEEEKLNGNGNGWSLKQETGTESYNVYHEGKTAMLDLFYSFMDENHPLLVQIFSKDEIVDIHNKIKQYAPYTLLMMTQIYKEDRYMTMLNDLLSIGQAINKAIAKQ